MNEPQMNPEIEAYMQNAQAMQKELELARVKQIQTEINMGQTSAYQSNKDPRLAEYQLDLKEELDRLFHLLSGHVIKSDPDGQHWEEPDDDRTKIFSDYGVKQIMNVISFYINKNTLLSNYDKDMIMWKVKDFGIELADLTFNRYEYFFYYPSPEDLYELYLPIVKENPETYPSLTITTEDGQILVDEPGLYSTCVKESQIELQNKLRHYPMIVLSLIDSVHSTYLRALGGRERDSITKNYHITESTSASGQMEMQQNKPRLMNPKTW